MTYGIKVEIWGEYALFTRPELKVERVTYDCITPSAARGILEAVYWHPGLKYIIDKINVLSPIKYANIKRNEVAGKINSSSIKSVLDGKDKMLYLNTKDCIQQRASLVLKDVHYVIEAHFVMTEKNNVSDNAGKFQDIITRRLKKGQCFHMPYLGCREFPANVRLYDFDFVPTVYQGATKDLGFMLFDMDYSDKNDIRPMFFKGVLDNGVLDLTNCEVYK